MSVATIEGPSKVHNGNFLLFEVHRDCIWPQRAVVLKALRCSTSCGASSLNKHVPKQACVSNRSLYEKSPPWQHNPFKIGDDDLPSSVVRCCARIVKSRTHRDEVT